MNTPEHLEKIKAKCEARIATELERPILLRDKTAIAGWRSTIAAITRYQNTTGFDPVSDDIIMAILAAWPEELL